MWMSTRTVAIKRVDFRQWTRLMRWPPWPHVTVELLEYKVHHFHMEVKWTRDKEDGLATRKRGGPGYEAIADSLRARIESGELPPGAVVPGENEIIADFGVGRETAYRALRLLREEGLTESRQGAPTRVRKYEPIRRSANKRLSSGVWGAGASMWSVDVRDENPEVFDLTVDRIEAPPRVAESLGVPRATPVVRRSRGYRLQKKPVLWATSYLPAEIADGTRIAEPDTGEGGIYARLAELGYRPEVFKEEVRARMPRPAERARLELGPGTPVITLVRTAATADGRVVEINDMILDAGSYVLDYLISS